MTIDILVPDARGLAEVQDAEPAIHHLLEGPLALTGIPDEYTDTIAFIVALPFILAGLAVWTADRWRGHRRIPRQHADGRSADGLLCSESASGRRRIAASSLDLPHGDAGPHKGTIAVASHRVTRG